VLTRLLLAIASRRPIPQALWVTLLLSLPFLATGLFLDDYPQRIAMLTGDLRNIFSTYDTRSALTQHEIAVGLRPWRFYPGSRLTFFGPLSQAFTALDLHPR